MLVTVIPKQRAVLWSFFQFYPRGRVWETVTLAIRGQEGDWVSELSGDLRGRSLAGYFSHAKSRRV